MARPSSSAQRNLTLMEELEKLEQSITLTLQEIDHNFSRAHRIVTSSILPVVDDYAKHSENVWESTKFWKQFFEASANVSLNSYEEPTAEETVTETETTMTETNEPSTSSYLSTPSRESAVPDFATPVSAKTYSTFQGDESLDFESPEATPRAGQGRNQPSASLAQYASPYEKLRREVQGNDEPSTPSSTLPSTPRGQTASEDPDDSTFMKPSTTRLHAQKQNARTPANDPLLHRVLDKNYRIQATPHSQVRLPSRSGAGGFELHTRTPVTGRRLPARGAADDLDSSPMMEAPKLNAEIFKSPAKSKRVPGVSVLTPAKKTVSQRDVDEDMQEDAKPLEATKMKSAKVWDSDSDDDDDEGLLEGMSPPKTMQFHIPQSKLLRTPAKEASKRIVDDLLLTAGGGISDDYDDSPSVIGKGRAFEDDTF